MNKFIQTYNSIILEESFKNKKWIEKGSYKDISIFENEKHLKERLKSRYEIEYDDWMAWNYIKSQIIKHLIEIEAWLKCSKKNPYQKGFTVHLTTSNMWLSGILQNDIDDKVQKIYFSTFLPEDPRFNHHDLIFDLPL